MSVNQPCGDMLGGRSHSVTTGFHVVGLWGSLDPVVMGEMLPIYLPINAVHLPLGK